MANTDPLISVIVPVYNCEMYLGHAIESVLNQKCESIELIVFDDGSTDSSGAVAKSFPEVKYHYQENAGVVKTRNVGLSMASGQYITFLDSDDLLLNNSLVRLSKVLQQQPEVAIAEGRLQHIYRNEVSGEFETKFEPFYHCSLGSCMIRRSAFDRVGDFEERLSFAEDVDWFTRAWELDVKKQRLEFTSLHTRRHKDNLTNNVTAKNRAKPMLFQLKLARQKANPKTGAGNGALRDYLGDLNVNSPLNL